jgi:hypothetical protein
MYNNRYVFEKLYLYILLLLRIMYIPITLFFYTNDIIIKKFIIFKNYFIAHVM